MTEVHGDVVRMLRRQAGMTQERLAAASALAVQTINRIERGRIKVSHPLTIKAIAEALDVQASMLVRR